MPPLPTPLLFLSETNAQLATVALEVEIDYGGDAPVRGLCALRDQGEDGIFGGIFIGRNQGNDIVLPSPLVGKRHARIDVVKSVPFVLDSKSTNGTFVATPDGQARRISNPFALKPYDAIMIGGYRLRVGVVQR